MTRLYNKSPWLLSSFFKYSGQAVNHERLKMKFLRIKRQIGNKSMKQRNDVQQKITQANSTTTFFLFRRTLCPNNVPITASYSGFPRIRGMTLRFTSRQGDSSRG